MTSGSANATARTTASRSSASATTGRAPRLRTWSCLDALRVIPTTSWTRATRSGTSDRPTTPVAPATKILMTGSVLRPPSRRARQPRVRDALPVAAHVVDPRRERERREERPGGVGHVHGGAHRRHRFVVAGARPVEEPEAKHDAAAAGAGEGERVALGDERRRQDRGDLADRRVLVGGRARRIDERDRRLHVDARGRRPRRVDEDR